MVQKSSSLETVFNSPAFHQRMSVVTNNRNSLKLQHRLLFCSAFHLDWNRTFSSSEQVKYIPYFQDIKCQNILIITLVNILEEERLRSVNFRKKVPNKPCIPVISRALYATLNRWISKYYIPNLSWKTRRHIVLNTQHPFISGTIKTIAVTWNNFISEYLNSNFHKFPEDSQSYYSVQICGRFMQKVVLFIIIEWVVFVISVYHHKSCELESR